MVNEFPNEEFSNGECVMVLELYKDPPKTRKHMGFYNKGKKHLEWTYWYQNEQKKMEGTFEEDKKQGKWKYWDESGDLTKVEYYQVGKLIHTEDPRLIKE